MEVINHFLRQLTTEQRGLLYNSFVAVSCVVEFSAVLYLSKKYGVDRKKLVWFAVINLIVLLIACELTVGQENRAFRLSSGNAVLLYTVLSTSMAKRFKIPIGKSLDITIPAYLAARLTVTSGCVFTGCCYGIPMINGIYSHVAGTTVFPCNQMEVIVSVLLLAVCLRVAKKTAYKGEGRIGACALTAFGILRFVSDLFRANDKFFGRTSFDGIVAAIMCITGLVLLYLIDNKKLQSLHTSEVSIN